MRYLSLFLFLSQPLLAQLAGPFHFDLLHGQAEQTSRAQSRRVSNESELHLYDHLQLLSSAVVHIQFSEASYAILEDEAVVMRLPGELPTLSLAAGSLRMRGQAEIWLAHARLWVIDDAGVDIFRSQGGIYQISVTSGKLLLQDASGEQTVLTPDTRVYLRSDQLLVANVPGGLSWEEFSPQWQSALTDYATLRRALAAWTPGRESIQAMRHNIQLGRVASFGIPAADKTAIIAALQLFHDRLWQLAQLMEEGRAPERIFSLQEGLLVVQYNLFFLSYYQ